VETDFVTQTTALSFFSTQTVLSLVTITSTIEQNITFTTTASGQTITVTTATPVPVTTVSTLTRFITAPGPTQTVPGPTQISLVSVPVLETSLVTIPGPTQTSLITITATRTLPAQTITFTTTLTQSGTTTTITTTSIIPASTVLSTITSTQTFVSIQTSPVTFVSIQTTPVTVVSVESVFPSVSTRTCSSACEVDVTATLLTYPGQVSTATVTFYSRSVDVYITEYPDGTNRTSTGPTITVPPPAPAKTSDITWDFSGVTLTYPTTYVAYFDFNHLTAVPVASGCLTATEELVLPSPTDFAPLVFPSASVTQSGLPPSALITYLNSLPTVTSQLGGLIGQSCDPIVGTTKTLTTATAQNIIQLTTVTAVVDTTSTHVTQAQEDLPTPPVSSAASAPAPTSVAPAPAPSSNTPAPPPASSAIAPVQTSILGTSAPSTPPLASSSPSAQSASSATLPTPQTSLTSFSNLASSVVIPASTQQSPGSSGSLQTTTKTTVPPPSVVSTSTTFSSFTGAAVRARGEMKFGGLEGWLIGAAGVGLGWL
ncbi:hypothetical protein K432DRAFT_406534, partial [Lepidopterella palustris CBS 459.81]